MPAFIPVAMDVLQALAFLLFVFAFTLFLGLLFALGESECEPEDTDEPWGLNVTIVPEGASHKECRLIAYKAAIERQKERNAS